MKRERGKGYAGGGGIDMLPYVKQSGKVQMIMMTQQSLKESEGANRFRMSQAGGRMNKKALSWNCAWHVRNRKQVSVSREQSRNLKRKKL